MLQFAGTLQELLRSIISVLQFLRNTAGTPKINNIHAAVCRNTAGAPKINDIRVAADTALICVTARALNLQFCIIHKPM